MEKLNKNQNQKLKKEITKAIKNFSNENAEVDKELVKDLLLWIFSIINQKTNYFNGSENEEE